MPTCLSPRYLVLAGLLFVLSFSLVLPRSQAQTPPDQTTAITPALEQAPSTPADSNPDGEVVGGGPVQPRTPAQLEDAAWQILTAAAGDARHAETRIQALAALGLLDSNPRSQKLIEAGMVDPDVDVRTAAVLAAGQTRSPSITTAMRRLLNDKEPQVAFAAALSLWKMGDRSGEDILMAVIDGERRASATLVNGTEHTISRDLHSPATLAKIGALQASGILLGPFGFGITAYEYIHKNGGDSARVNAIEAISQQKTEPIRENLLGALMDKDPAVRAAAAKAIATYHELESSRAIAKLFDDTKPPVRYTAAAAYLISTSKSPASPLSVLTVTKPRARRTH